MTRPVERRKEERNEGADVWEENERKALVKLGPLFEKYQNRKGKQKENKEKSFLEELGINL